MQTYTNTMTNSHFCFEMYIPESNYNMIFENNKRQQLVLKELLSNFTL
jgi:hypothetical protein